MSSGRQNKFWIGICPRIEPRVWHSPRVWAFLESSQVVLEAYKRTSKFIHEDTPSVIRPSDDMDGVTEAMSAV